MKIRIIALVLPLALSACQPTSSPVEASAGNRIYQGLIPRDDSFIWTSTVGVEIDGIGLCSGVLISPQEVLTAAHCVALDERESLPSRVHFYAAGGAQVGTVEVLSAAYPKEYTATKLNRDGINSDLALLRLRGVAPASSRPLRVQDSSDFVRTGLSLLVIGLGRTSKEDQGEKIRYTMMNLEKFVGTKRTYSMELVSKSSTSCPGDSGGPAVALLGDQPTVIGIASLGSLDCTSGARTYYTYVPTFLRWLQNASEMIARPEAEGKLLRPSALE